MFSDRKNQSLMFPGTSQWGIGAVLALVFIPTLPAFSQEAVMLYGHVHKPVTAQFSSDGQTILSWNRKEIFLWDVKTQKTIHRIGYPDESYFPPRVDFLPGSQRLLITSYLGRDGNVNGWKAWIWDPNIPGFEVHASGALAQERVLGYLPKKNALVIANMNTRLRAISSIKFISAADKSLSELKWNPPQISHVIKSKPQEWIHAFSADESKMLVVAEEEQTIRNVSDNKILTTIKAPWTDFDKAWLSIDCKTIVAKPTQPSNSVCLWDVENRRKKDTLKLPLALELVSFSSDGRLIALGGNGRIVLYSLVTERMEKLIPVGGLRLHSIGFSPDCKSLIVGEENGTIQILRVPEIEAEK